MYHVNITFESVFSSIMTVLDKLNTEPGHGSYLEVNNKSYEICVLLFNLLSFLCTTKMKSACMVYLHNIS